MLREVRMAWACWVPLATIPAKGTERGQVVMGFLQRGLEGAAEARLGRRVARTATATRTVYFIFLRLSQVVLNVLLVQAGF